MTPLLLQDALAEFLKKELGTYLLDTNTEIKKAPQIVKNFLPLKGTSDTPDFPFVIIRMGGEEDTGEQAIVTVKLIVGVLSEDVQQGSGDLLNLIERTRQALFKKRVIDKRFRVEYPFEWEAPDEQPYPEWMAVITTRWTIPKLIEEDDYGQRNFGEAAGC